MRIAVIAIMALGLGLAVAGQSRAQGFLANMLADLRIGADRTKELDSRNSALVKPFDPDLLTGPASAGNGYAGSGLRVPGTPSLIPLTPGSLICRTDLGSCNVNVVAAAGQACWCPTNETFATGKVVAP
ncbi:hypothetical protein [Phenylobacterium ferrooxidans]|uniref:Uncharacterized protein n=1 Tax=Phenylobacterium ferrooxidans TaxID=2982689 RepID=A0ABW6CR41_9CAUL